MEQLTVTLFGDSLIVSWSIPLSLVGCSPQFNIEVTSTAKVDEPAVGIISETSFRYVTNLIPCSRIVANVRVLMTGEISPLTSATYQVAMRRK